MSEDRTIRVSRPGSDGDRRDLEGSAAAHRGSGRAEPGRRLGQGADALAEVCWLPDDIGLIGRAIEADGRPFAGAQVPVALHDAGGAEAAYDAAEWAAELLATRAPAVFVVTPFVPPSLGPVGGGPTVLGHRSWNHALAMIDRLGAMCDRLGVELRIRESANGRLVRDPSPDGLPLVFGLDSAGLRDLGWVPAELAPRAD